MRVDLPICYPVELPQLTLFTPSLPKVIPHYEAAKAVYPRYNQLPTKCIA